MKAKAFIFDLGNVIINLHDMQQWWQHLAGLVDEHQLLKLRNEGFFLDYETGRISNQAFLSQLLQHKTRENVTEHTLHQAWVSLLGDIPPARIRLLKDLSQQFPLYLLSNTNHLHLDYILNELQNAYGHPVFDEIFSQTYYSQIIGLAKPDTAIYQHVLDDAALHAADCLFLDDKLENLEAAAALGIQTALVSPEMDIHHHLSHLLTSS